ncbi:MAG: hypothetical protein WCK76_13670, partial [Elusimicrobiota bacterium]
MKRTIQLLIAWAITLAAAGPLPAGEFEKALAGYKTEDMALPDPAPSPAEWAALAGQEKHSSYDLLREGEILSMKPAELAAATPERKIEMLQFLVKNSVTTEQAYRGVSAQDYRERMIVR